MKNITIRKYSYKWKETNLLDDLKFREIAKSKSAIEEILREILKDNKQFLKLFLSCSAILIYLK